MANKKLLADRIEEGNNAGAQLQTFASYKEGYKVGGGLTLCDPITQISRRIQAFFEGDKEVITSFNVNNNAEIVQPTYDGDGHVITPGSDHLAELCIFVQNGKNVEDTRKADCISNFIRHRHVYPEYNFAGELLRNHILNVRVFAIGAVDPNDPTQNERVSECTFIDDEASQVPNTYDGRVRKFEQLELAFRGNPCIAGLRKYTTITGAVWFFIECGRKPVTFQEDNITNLGGFTSELPTDILPLAFVFNGDFQISTYVNPYEK